MSTATVTPFAAERMELGTTAYRPALPMDRTSQRRARLECRAAKARSLRCLARGCLEDPERPAIIIEDGPVMTRREFLDRCQRFAGYLSGMIKAGDRVVVMLDNRLEFMIALFAIIANRATMVSIAPTAMQYDAGHIVTDAAPAPPLSASRNFRS